MPNPKYRFSKTRTLKRRTHYKLELPTLIICSNCGASVQYHRVCSECGHYKGRLAIEKNATA